ncbi:MAG: hypothetical protein RL193_1045 [Actinomycetota bacterium]
MKSKRFLQFILFFLILSTFENVYADSSELVINKSSGQYKTWDFNLSSKCKGRVDYPHISKHVKGTVNIILSLDCPSEFLSITGVLYRNPVKVPADLAFKHASGRNSLKMSLAVPCRSNKGVSTHLYFLTGTFIATRHLPVVKNYSWPVPC